MTDDRQRAQSSFIEAGELLPRLRQVDMFAGQGGEGLECLGRLELVRVRAGELLFDPGSTPAFWILLEGEIAFEKTESDGSRTAYGTMTAGQTFGGIPILTGRNHAITARCRRPGELVRIDEESFWRLMCECPSARQVILANSAQRLDVVQAHALHREKLMSLGTLAAGLMHELSNPGAAARRAAAQLRQNLGALQQLSLRFCDREMTAPQLECMRALQTHALEGRRQPLGSTLEQAEAEEAMERWLADAGVVNAHHIAPTLISVGITPQELECTEAAFREAGLSDMLNWLDSLVSSVQLVGTIEESVNRVTELVVAVKKYAYEDKGVERLLDVHDSIHSTLTVMNYKLRSRDIRLQKQLDASPPTILTSGTGLTQVWTNLLDNAIDASPRGGVLTIATAIEGGSLTVRVEDQGAGIPEHIRSHIFEPFFTTKAVGKGTGLGLDIVHRIVTGNFGGEIEVESRPGETRFLVRLPLAPARC